MIVGPCARAVRIGLTRWLLYRCNRKVSALQEHIAVAQGSLPLLVAHGLTTQRKPTWLMPLSIGCAWRAAGR